MKTPVDVLLAVAAIGGKLDIVEGDALRTVLPRDCPPALKDAIRRHKPDLVALLRLEFHVVRADALNATVLWTRDEANKGLLIAAGAELGSIYTVAELELLVHGQVNTEELRAIHTARQRFNAKLTDYVHTLAHIRQA
jgi:hypothetical protein